LLNPRSGIRSKVAVKSAIVQIAGNKPQHGNPPHLRAQTRVNPAVSRRCPSIPAQGI
jgi:hypothetical protein